MDEHRTVLDSSIDAEDFAEVAQEAGWTLIAENEKTADRPYELIYRADKDGKSTAHYVDDRFIMVRYAAARGPKKAAIVADIEELLPFETDKHILTEAEKNRDDQQEMIDWLMSATTLRDQAGHARLVKLVEKRLADENAAVRRAALLAASWLEWPDFRKTIEKMAEDETDAAGRKDAERLADAYGLRDKGKL